MKLSQTLLSLTATALISLCAAPAFAQASVQCKEYPAAEKRTEAELQEHLTQLGWKVRRVEETCTCLKVYGTTPDGKRIAAYFDPKTFEQVDED